MAQQIRQSAVSFKGEARFHLGLMVSDLEASINFYTNIFGQQPTKVRPGYAKFEVEQPSVNFTLNQVENTQPGRNLSHLGIQLQDTGALEQKRNHFQNLGFTPRIEEQTACCYALQDKFWLQDPDLNEVEFFVVLEKEAVPAQKTSCCV